MGQIKLPNGSTVQVDELQGNMDLNQIIRDLRSAELTDSFLIQVIGVLGRLGKHAVLAVDQLEALAIGDNTLLKQAATQALKKINAGSTTLVPHQQTSSILGAHVPASRGDEYESHWHGTHSQQSHSHHGTQFTGNRDYSGHNNSTAKKPDVNKVTLTEMPVDPEKLEDGARAYTECRFCAKMCLVGESHKAQSRRLSGAEKYYCNFCLRNEYYGSRVANDTMILSYRGLIGYYYYAFYVAPKSASMYLMDIKDMIELHVTVGSANPLMRYDQDTYCWFIDFARIGKGRNRLPVEVVLTTIVEQIACFNVYENVRVASPRKYNEKFQEAVLLFLNERKRKWDMPVFSPSLYGCDIPTHLAGVKPIPVELLHTFVPAHLMDNHGTNKNRRY